MIGDIEMDNFIFDEEHREVRQMVRNFAHEEIKPLAAKRDEEEYFDWDSYKKMASIGLTGIPWPEKYGGAGMDFRINSSMCKAYVSEMALKVTTEALQILGGYIRDYPIERMMRDARITQIYTGTVEMQRIEIAEHYLE